MKQGLPMAILIALAPMSAIPHEIPAGIFKAQPFSGRVVDKSTNAPLQGVAVLVAWRIPKQAWLPIQPRNLHFFETATDANGRYAVPSWGPVSYTGLIEGPIIVLFKSGYRSGGFSNANSTTNADHQRSEQDQRDLPLPRFEGTMSQYADDLSLLDIRLRTWTLAPLDCDWTRFPRMVAALDVQQKAFEAANVRAGLLPRSLRNPTTEGKCGAVDTVIAKRAPARP